MTRAIMKRFLRFRASEKGSAPVEFAIYFTVIMAVLASSVEIAYLNMRHAMLERAVDLTVRDIRLSTGAIPSYEEVRTDICDRAAVLDDCVENMRLEMTQVDPRVFVGIGPGSDCINAEEDPRPVRNFENGNENDLMLIRACAKFKPIFPTTGIASHLNLDEQGYARLIVTSAFVQEPR